MPADQPRSLVHRVAQLSPRQRALLEIQLAERLGMAPAHRSPGAKQLVAYVVPRRQPVEPPDARADDGAQGDLVSRWKQVYDEIYSRGDTGQDATFNIVGWSSSYTGLPIPAEEMREQVEATVERILARRPRRILEMGCGTGLLLFRLAPTCERYIATDFSPVAVEYVQELSTRLGLSQVRVARAAADDHSSVDAETFDAIVLNSVVQYFPSAAYLRRVLARAIDRLAPDGCVFIGDVRSLPILDAFQTSIELHDASAALPVERLRERVRRRAAHEQELVIDPAFFEVLKRELPRITSVESRPKRGRHWNELTRFRYDVTLHTAPIELAVPPHPTLDWDRDALDIASLTHRLSEPGDAVLEVRGIPDARVAREIEAVQLLASPEGPKTAGELERSLRLLPDSGADIERLYDLARDAGYNVDVRLSSRGVAGRLDVLFARGHADGDGSRAFPWQASDDERWRLEPQTALANRPLDALQAQQHLPELRSFLHERLPDHMVPAVFVLLDALPVTAGGKLDRQALPTPDHVRPELAGRYVGPRTPIEKRLVEIEESLLGLARIGVHDNFFTELGGHSLLATQLASRIRDAFKIDLGLRQIFETPTIALMAEALAGASPSATAAGPIRSASDSAVDVDRLSDAEVETMLETLVREREGHE